MLEPVVFAGPSQVGLPSALRQGLQWHPPARRGDVDRLLAARGRQRDQVLVLADGLFGFEPAVSHAELCRAIDAGWQVWGCSSMGAIRAWELRDQGMRGHGWVHAQFAAHQDFTDDELALLHLPVAPWDAFSEPLVNLRHALLERGTALGIGVAVQRRLIALLQPLWFGERTTALMLDLMVGPLGVPAAASLALLDHLDQRRIKNLDLQDLLRRRPWQARVERTARRRG
jgi:hypothetical protein